MKIKFSEYVQKVAGYLRKSKKRDKIKMCIALLLIGVVFCIVGNDFGKKNSIVKDGTTGYMVSNDDSYNHTLNETESEAGLEERLEEILGAINGVGQVKVLVTYDDEGERIPMENVSEKSTQDDDSRTSERSCETDIITEDNENGETVAVRRHTYPSIRGVIVVAEGASDVELRSELIVAVAAVTGVSQHRIRVMDM